MTLVRSISGLRATVGDDMNPILVAKYVAAFCASMPEGDVIVGRDGRPSGEWIESVCIGALRACGRNVISLGIVPTPTVQLFAEHTESACGGIAITASHNPVQWNGLKFINSDGVFLNADENAKLWEKLDSENFSFAESLKYGSLTIDSEAVKKHVKKILELPLFTLELLSKIKNRKFKIVIDAVNASGSIIVPYLLENLSCEVIPLYCDASGLFPHTPEPLPENLTELAAAVKSHNADLGIAVDPDADRLVMIDHLGEPIGEERTICVAVESALSFFYKLNLGKYDKVACVNHSTTMTVDKIANSLNAKGARAAVGEINVVEKMKATKAIIGGEGSGGVILPACHYGRDSLVGIALTLVLMAYKEASLKDIVDSYPKFEMIKTKMPFSGNLDEYIPAIKNAMNGFEIIAEDGIKAQDANSWAQLRKSNTEPIIRIIAEAQSREIADELIKRLQSVMK
jgi:phosphomannomutase